MHVLSCGPVGVCHSAGNLDAAHLMATEKLTRTDTVSQLYNILYIYHFLDTNNTIRKEEEDHASSKQKSEWTHELHISMSLWDILLYHKISPQSYRPCGNPHVMTTAVGYPGYSFFRRLIRRYPKSVWVQSWERCHWAQWGRRFYITCAIGSKLTPMISRYN